jgi:hypothetical protein
MIVGVVIARKLSKPAAAFATVSSTFNLPSMRTGRERTGASYAAASAVVACMGPPFARQSGIFRPLPSFKIPVNLDLLVLTSPA